ncbi:MAG: hypothetical protein IT426_13715 [Pirellulales bacterium]|nr:hypothetical protein [Pirellulales bacterium]
MNESKINLTTRLRREGRWAEASKFKDETLKKLRGEGVKRAEAGEKAWERMAAMYPPLAPNVEAAPETALAMPEKPLTAQSSSGIESNEIDALLDRIGDGRPSDLVQDTLWTYENLANSRIKASDAPSVGSWGLLLWARQYRNRFFEQVLPKAMTNKPPPEEEENGRRERRSVAEMERVLEGLNQQFAEELAADVPETVKTKVRGILGDWERRYAITIAGEAKTSLEAHFIRLAQNCVDALAPEFRGV